MKKDIEKIFKSTNSVVVALQHAQSVDGYITKEAVALIADVFGKSQCEVYSTATFYHQFTFEKKGRNVISVCMGTACFVCGAGDILKKIEDELGIKAGEVTKDGKYSIEHNVRCVGKCDAAPVVMVGDKMIEKATVAEVVNEIKRLSK
ncbi:MAG: NAD(P)H-dependent oxidoreductase subunit E [Christensenellaceae bacterium]|jgi:NADH-quinone oxidoreductase subunit E|nr:NAD(P)H-dependent oxidoreductase subunit E [Christensenellaceae bacterium]